MYRETEENTQFLRLLFEVKMSVTVKKPLWINGFRLAHAKSTASKPPVARRSSASVNNLQKPEKPRSHAAFGVFPFDGV
jgi:hypothetical protein